MNLFPVNIVFVLFFLLVISLVFFLEAIMAPFVAGFILGYLGDPLVDRMEKLGLPRTFGVLVVFLFFGAVVGIAIFILLPLVLSEMGELIGALPQVFAWFQKTLGPLFISNFGLDPFHIEPEQIGNKVLENWVEAGGVMGTIMSRITYSAFAFFSATGSFFLSLVVAFYFMRDCDSIFDQLYKLIPRRYELTALKLGTECDEILGAFLRGQLWVMFIVGCIYSFGLYMLGIDQAILIGMVSGVASIIPYLGFVLGFVGAAIAALIQFNELYYIVYIAVIFLIAQGVESMILTPWLVGDKIGLHPLAVIFSLMLGGFLFGLVGVLLALPFAAVAMVIIRHFHLIYVDSEIYLQREGAED